VIGDPDELETCGCCGGVHDVEPVNRPGLPALRWRNATHGQLFGRMKARLPEVALADGPHAGDHPLLELTTRAGDDPSIALLDASAVAFDILGFYSERIANEGYLRTATERRSVRELARTLGYELRPGVAASTHVAITIDDPFPSPAAPPPPPFVTVPAGTKVQSVPGAGELPQTFETAAAIEARAGWNALRPRVRVRHQLAIVSGALRWLFPDGTTSGVSVLWFAGDLGAVKPGDRLVVAVASEHRDASDPQSLSGRTGTVVVIARAVTVVRPTDPTKPTFTRIALVGPSHAAPSAALPSVPEAVPTATPIKLTAAAVRTWILGKRWTDPALRGFLATQRWSADAVTAQVAALRGHAPAPADVHRFLSRTGVFGHNAPSAAQVIAASDTSPWPNWDDPQVTVWTKSDGTTKYSTAYGADVMLDRVVELAAGGWAILEGPGGARHPFTVTGVTEAALADFAMSGKATGLDLGVTATFKASAAGQALTLRRTTVHAASEPIELAGSPVPGTIGVSGDGVDQIVLDRLAIGLGAGRVVAVTGERVDEDGQPTGEVVTELATLLLVEHIAGYTRLRFTAPLAHGYVRASLAINANVVLATHGETIAAEPLGSGDATLANQRFVLKRPPVTYVSAATPSGAASTVEIRVDGVVWKERAALYGAGPDERCYALSHDDDGRTTVTFGDGVHGARLPIGRDNVFATYRTGIGVAGHVPAGRLTILTQRPLGVRAATNPEPAAGAQDGETIDEARRAAPLTVLTLDRVVSRRDYEDFARTFAGIGKAIATEAWSGRHRIVHLTIAGATPGPVDLAAPLATNLVQAIARASDRGQQFRVDGYVPLLFAVKATLRVRAGLDPAAVKRAATERLERHFGFAARDLGQPVTASEVIAVLDRVRGVIAIDLDRLHTTTDAPTLRAAVPAPSAAYDPTTGAVTPAALLIIQPTAIDLAIQLDQDGAA
jgi:predicted phage baseplate assembly protein